MANDVDDANALDLMDDEELEGSYFEEPDDPSNQEGNNTDNVGDDSEENPPSSTSNLDNGNLNDDDSGDFTKEVLRLKGISDPNKIKFEDESGAIVERSWNDLTTQELLNILTSEGNPETDLVDDEINLINAIRKSNMSPNDFIAALQQEAVQKAYDAQEPTYTIDELEDDELFALDLIEKVGEENITDEEIQLAISDAKQNEALYKRQIEALRNQYKTLEDERRYAKQNEEIAAQEQSFQDFSNTILQEIKGFNQLGNQEVELSVDDMNDLANFILTRDENGVSDFGRVMNDPRTFTMAAFWTLKGPEIMAEMLELIQEAYKRGFADGGKTPVKNNNRVTIQKPSQKSSLRYSNDTFDPNDESYLGQ